MENLVLAMQLVMPWQQVHCDSIGNWEVHLRARTLTFHAMTMIDACTNLVEIKRTLTTTSAEGAAAVENTWLARYPRPEKIVTDQGPEFQSEFTEMCERNGVKHHTSTSRNPQGNSLIEAIHKTIGQVLRTVTRARNPRSIPQAEAVIEETLATAMHACRCACSESLQDQSPGSLAFSRDMFLDIPLIADIMSIQANRQRLIDRRLMRANAKRNPSRLLCWRHGLEEDVFGVLGQAQAHCGRSLPDYSSLYQRYCEHPTWPQPS